MQLISLMSASTDEVYVDNSTFQGGLVRDATTGGDAAVATGNFIIARRSFT
jgi:hypothetical protein